MRISVWEKGGKTAKWFTLFIAAIGMWSILFYPFRDFFLSLGANSFLIFCIQILITLFCMLGFYISVMNLLGRFFPSIALDWIQEQLDNLKVVRSNPDKFNLILYRIYTKLKEFKSDPS